MSWNPYKSWKRKHVDDVASLVEEFQADKPVIGGGDTETTGLHIKKDKAFLIIFGWLSGDSGKVFTFYPTKHNMKIFFSMAEKLKMFVWWNTTYDLHMMTNTGFTYQADNLIEGTVIARLCTEAKSAREGGDSLALKAIGTKYVHGRANQSEILVKEELKKLNDERVKFLTAALRQFDHPTETEHKPFRLDTGKKTTKTYADKNKDNVEWKTVKKKWNKGSIEKFLKDIAHDVEDLPEEVAEVWRTFAEEYPEPTYEDIDRDLMIEYAGDDVITMLEYVRKAVPILNARDQWRTVKREAECIYPIYEMERQGLQVDQEYLETSRRKVKAYIIQQRQELHRICGWEINISGNSNDLYKYFKSVWDMDLPSTDKAQLKKIIENYDDDRKRVAKLVKELRTLEKWYSTYIVRVQKIAAYDGKAYTQIFQAGAVSGRVGSDFQQFPKDNLKDEEGNELYHPRKAFVVPDGFDYIYYLDFSQIELRNQANYTILVSGGDLNLCRAYMPFLCHRKEGNFAIPYDYEDPELRKEWNKYDWYLDEAPDTKWTPTDVHSETTHNALVALGYEVIEKYKRYEMEGTDIFYQNVTKDYELHKRTVITEEIFKKMRSKGKIFNFMRNYGGGKMAAMEQLDIPESVADALVTGYSEAFPHVQVYQNKISSQHAKKGYITNMYDRRYYLEENRQAYKLANYNVQGTCADMMKECMIACHKYLKKKHAKGFKTQMVLPVHDEIQFYSVKGEENIIRGLKMIMEKHDWHLVPIVCDAERTSTNWADKEEIEL